MATQIVASKDGKFQRTWETVPAVTWSCRRCWVLVAQHDMGAHLKAHADDDKTLAELGKKIGFGT